ncbi:ComF family protein [Mucilaginibacter lappiensis]|uniref:ComF family protein n=1 Tax=Mucilaginibacter lappiensis TaxID=354630 RepID=A0A1N7DJV3_9SPHI|nr:phosphoribosyltransferase family protein [Mucilaginibacter lappiensis]MBB6111353.1 ComF family protein [Mucilaginibacter lappiensis]MBB6129635.1 ComF family protein [Mucilaginibacter lappiensis]SIR76048.1 comF family protein [Mucilaginibacter lappiensis]
MKLLRGYLSDFVSLLFPELCPACQVSLVANEYIICSDCRYNLPYTNFHLQADNIVAQQFYGKLKVEAAYALYYFTKGGKIQNLMHHFKYKGMQRIGNLLGNMAGIQLAENPIFNTVDLIIPVPLHKKRMRERGYNQSTRFAEGLAEKLPAIVEDDNLQRSVATATQTHKSRFARFENMQDVFMIKHPERLIDKHILLVDDIVTTGSTLEACGIELLKIPGLKLSIATIAYAQ